MVELGVSKGWKKKKSNKWGWKWIKTKYNCGRFSDIRCKLCQYKTINRVNWIVKTEVGVARVGDSGGR